MNEPRRERKKRDTRRRIGEAAWSLFLEKGYTATTIEDIAAAADIAKRTFFRYFPSKDALLYTDSEEDTVALAEALASRPADEPCWTALCGAYIDITPRLVAKRDHLLLRHAIARTIGEQTANWISAVGSINDIVGTAVATRLGVESHHRSARLVSGAALSVAAVAYLDWVEDGAIGDLAAGYAAAFDALNQAVSDAHQFNSSGL